ncbi:hypothetical protein KI387_018263, partial [Taxus chinensis]
APLQPKNTEEPRDEEMKDDEEGVKEIEEEMGDPSSMPHSTQEGEGPTQGSLYETSWKLE